MAPRNHDAVQCGASGAHAIRRSSSHVLGSVRAEQLFQRATAYISSSERAANANTHGPGWVYGNRLCHLATKVRAVSTGQTSSTKSDAFMGRIGESNPYLHGCLLPVVCNRYTFSAYMSRPCLQVFPRRLPRLFHLGPERRIPPHKLDPPRVVVHPMAVPTQIQHVPRLVSATGTTTHDMVRFPRATAYLTKSTLNSHASYPHRTPVSASRPRIP